MQNHFNSTTWTYSYVTNGTSYTQVSTSAGVYNQAFPKKKNIHYKYLLSKE